MDLYSLIYPICFYSSSLLISFPFLKIMKYYEARLFSLVVLSIVTFVVAYFIPFKTAFYLCFVILLLISMWSIRSVKIDFTELAFVLVFAFFIFLRFLNPDILDCEKLMDMAFLSSVLKSNAFPPNDPFFAGGKIDFYYYFGHVISACITLMSFAPPEIGYNIAIATLPAYSSILIFGLLREYTEKYAVLGVCISIFSGNAYSVFDFFRRILQGVKIDGSYYWNSTRVVEKTINEFPYFSFIHADLHAHVVAIPLKILLLVLLYRCWKGENRYIPLITPLMFVIFATNSWDFPLMFLFALITAAISKREVSIKLLISTILSLIPIFILYSSMNVPSAKFFYVEDHSDLIQFLSYALFPLILAYSYYLDRKLIYALPAALSFIISPILLVLSPLAVLSAYRAIRRDFLAAVILIGVLAFILPEFVAIESRLNTVFKFYLIGWLFLTIPSSINIKSFFRTKAKYLFLILLILCLIYPLAATPVRYNARALTLDGMNYIKYLDGDYEAIKWLRGKSGIVLEGGYTSYKYGGRVAAFTGNPSVVAWVNHEVLWRRNGEELGKRMSDVRKFFSTQSCDEMKSIVHKYNVSYIFVGFEEKRVFSANSTLIGMCFKKVFESRGTTIFASNDSVLGIKR